MDAIHYYGKVLYYPYIKITNFKWIKSAALYYKQLERIVPGEINPKDGYIVKTLQDAGFLVNHTPRAQMIDQLGVAFLDFIDQNVSNGLRKDISAKLESIIPISQPFGVSTYKMSHNLKEELPKRKLAVLANDGNSDIYYLERTVGALYMTFLANRIAQEQNVPVISSDVVFQDLIHSVNTEAYQGERDLGYALASLVIKAAVPENIERIPIEKILEFRRNCEGERHEFYTKINELVKDLKSLDGRPALQEVLNAKQDTINNAVKALEKSYKSMRFTAATAFLSLSVPAVLSGIGIVVAAGGTAALAIGKLIGQKADYDKTRMASPYSYVLSMKNLHAESFARQLIKGKFLL